MPQVLQFTVPQKEVDELLTETDNRITYEKENIEKPNPETAKPVIYLYPEQETKVNVQLTFNGTLTSTYPALPRKAGPSPRSRTVPSPMRRAEATVTFSGRELRTLTGSRTAVFLSKRKMRANSLKKASLSWD